MSLAISWTIAENVTVTSYTVSYSNRNLNCFNDSNSISRIPVSQSTYTLTGLEERTEYSITVTAYLPRGRTEARNVYGTTLTAAPTTPPTSIKIKVTTSTSVTVSWGQ
jgi:hypothetical protein